MITTAAAARAGQRHPGLLHPGGIPQAPTTAAAQASRSKRRSASPEEGPQEGGPEVGGKLSALQLVRQKARKLSPSGERELSGRIDSNDVLSSEDK